MPCYPSHLDDGFRKRLCDQRVAGSRQLKSSAYWWINAGPTSATLTQHLAIRVAVSYVCRDYSRTPGCVSAVHHVPRGDP